MNQQCNSLATPRDVRRTVSAVARAAEHASEIADVPTELSVVDVQLRELSIEISSLSDHIDLLIERLAPVLGGTDLKGGDSDRPAFAVPIADMIAHHASRLNGLRSRVLGTIDRLGI
jgi:hypothetical protein